MEVQIKAYFNKQTKDSKKELIQFHVTGDGEKKPELDLLCREVVELEIEGIDVTITAEYSKKSKDGKKTTLEFIVKGDTSAAQTFEFYKKAGSDVTLTVAKAQMSLEDFREEPREGVRGKINNDGTVQVDGDQLSIEDVGKAAEEAASAAEKAGKGAPASGTYTEISEKLKGDKVTDIASKRGKQKDEQNSPDPAGDDLPLLPGDDLPF